MLHAVLPSLQVWDAHTYLLANPCKPTPIITITSTTGKSRPKDAAAPKDAPADASPNQGCIGGFFNITVAVRDKVSRAPVGIVPVTLSLDPSSLVSCSGAATRSTGKRSGAVWSCRRSKGGARGALTIAAAAAESRWYTAASGSVTVPV